MCISSTCPMVQFEHISAHHQHFWPLQNKVQVPRKVQSDNRTAQGCSSSPSEAQVALVAPWRCLRKYPINRLPHWAPTLPWEHENHAKKCVLLQWCPGYPMPGVGLSKHGWAQVIAAVGRDEPVENEYFFYYSFFLSFFFFTSYMMDELSKKDNLV